MSPNGLHESTWAFVAATLPILSERAVVNDDGGEFVDSFATALCQRSRGS